MSVRPARQDRAVYLLGGAVAMAVLALIGLLIAVFFAGAVSCSA